VNKNVSAAKKEQMIIGWREWVGLPELKVERIKVKVDTGARTSSLHAFDVERFRRGGKSMVRFSVHPLQRSHAGAIRTTAELMDRRKVRSSSGESEMRLVIHTELAMGEDRWAIELNLTQRDVMGFRMLLGREAIRRRCLVDSGRSFLSSKKVAPRR